MNKDELRNMTPAEVRKVIREGKFTEPTHGLCNGYVQCNLVILPKEIAYDFLLFAQRNPKPCPVLEVSDVGRKTLKFLAEDVDIARDFPKYNIYENGLLKTTCCSIDHLWRDDFVSFLIGCSFSFEEELIEAGIPMRNHQEDCAISMYNTNIPCVPAGIFKGNMVVSMRPIAYNKVSQAFALTGAMPRVHGAPIHVGNPEMIGIKDLRKTDFGGGVVTIKENEVPVFWACGVTPQATLFECKPKIVITHAPGYMLITDRKNVELK